MTEVPMLALNDGTRMPQLGFGIWQFPAETAASTVRSALETGYRLIDGAYIYGNEAGLGEGLRSSGVARKDVFITTKVWNGDQGRDKARASVERSLAAIGVDQLDLVLIHWPLPSRDLYVETWQALIDLNKEGRAKSIGVSNFGEEHLRRIIEETGYAPVVNQIELHPSFQQREMRAVHEELGIATESWSPLGQGGGFDNETIRGIAEEIGQSPAAVTLRWHLQHGLIAIPKASSRAHMADNFSALSFELSEAQMDAIDALDNPGGRIGPPPEDVN